VTGFQDSRTYRAWGRAHRFTHAVARPRFADEAASLLAAPDGPAPVLPASVLPYGMGRSYGDSCLNRDGGLIDARGLDRFVAFDRQTGLLEVEGGVTLADILRVLDGARPGEPRWFLPVTPGTKFVTVGGAIANDVHGKNHHEAGTFGRHVAGLALLRSDGRVLDCSMTDNPELFAATIGGLGLTGLILRATIRLKPVPGPWLESEDIRYDTLEDFFALSAESLAGWEYSVAWIDCLATGRSLGRGIFTRSRHTDAGPAGAPAGAKPHTAYEPRLSVPLDFPGFALNKLSITAFNALYRRRIPAGGKRGTLHYDPVFYPLDAIGLWNRMYGARGFYQYQCAVPTAGAAETVRALLETIAAAGQGSFLAVLKTLGDVPSPGLLSFPMPGVTLALDFPNTGAATHALLDRLDAIVAAAGGRLYPAKDGRMPAGLFQGGYPRWREFAAHIDPRFSSSFWRRVSVPVDHPSHPPSSHSPGPRP
jgi:FAD/FMN-containing dehydrogenase